MNEENLKWLYDSLRPIMDGLPDYEAFKLSMATEANRRWLFDTVLDNQLIEGVPDFKTFSETFAPSPPDQVAQLAPRELGKPQPQQPLPVGVRNPEPTPEPVVTATRLKPISSRTEELLQNADPRFMQQTPTGVRAEPIPATVASPEVNKQFAKQQQNVQEAMRDPNNRLTQDIPENLRGYARDFLSTPNGRNFAEARGYFGAGGEYRKWDEGAVAEVTGAAIQTRGKAFFDDLKGLMETVPPEQLNNFWGAVSALMPEVIDNNDDGIEDVGENGMTIREQILSNIPPSLRDKAIKAVELNRSLEAVQGDLNTYMDYFPNERMSRGRQALRGQALQGSVLQKPYQAIASITDGVADLIGGLYPLSQKILAAADPLADIEQTERNFGVLNEAANAISNWYDNNIRATVDKQIFDQQGNFKPENISNAVASALPAMAAVIYSGGAASGVIGQLGMGARASNIIGQTIAGTAFTYNDFYEDARRGQNLSIQDAANYALAASAAQGVIEAFAPSEMIIGRVTKRSFDGALEAVKKGTLSSTEVFTHLIAKELPREVLEEIVAYVGEKGVNAAANTVFNAEFDDEVTLQGLAETAIVSAATIGLLSAFRGKSNLAYNADDLKTLVDNFDKFEQVLDEGVASGRITKDEAQAVWERVYVGTSTEAQARRLLEPTPQSEKAVRDAANIVGATQKVTYQGKELTITEERTNEDGEKEVRGTYADGTKQDWIPLADAELPDLLAGVTEALQPTQPAGQPAIQPATQPTQPTARPTQASSPSGQRRLTALSDARKKLAQAPAGKRQQAELEMLNAIDTIEKSGDTLTPAEQRQVDTAKKRLTQKGYKTTPAKESNSRVVQRIADDTLAEGERVIEEVRPAITKSGKVVRKGEVRIREGKQAAEAPVDTRSQVARGEDVETVKKQNLDEAASDNPLTKANAVFNSKRNERESDAYTLTPEEKKQRDKAEAQLKKQGYTVQEKSDTLAKEGDVVDTTDATEDTELTEKQLQELEKAASNGIDEDVVIITNTTTPTVLKDGKVVQRGRQAGIRIPKATATKILEKNRAKQRERMPTNEADLAKTLETVFSLPTKEAKAAAKVIDSMIGAMADRESRKTGKRVTKEDIYKTLRWQKGLPDGRQAPPNARAARVLKDGQRIIVALTNPDVSSPLHELAHVFEDYLTPEEQQTIIDFAKSRGVKGDTWTRETSEVFAEGFETYMRNGKVPNSKLRDIFERFKEWITTFASLQGISPQMERIYDSMFTEGEKFKEVGKKMPKGMKQTEGMTPVAREAQVGDFVTSGGKNWFVVRANNGVYDLVSEDLQQTRTTTKIDEVLTPDFPQPVRGTKLVYEGKDATVERIDKNNYVLNVGGKRIKVPINPSTQLIMAAAARMGAVRQDTNAALDNLKELFQASQPADEPTETLFQTADNPKLREALYKYADKWIQSTGSLAYTKFLRTLPQNVRDAIDEAQLKEIFETTPSHVSLRDKRRVKAGERAEASFGTQERKGAKSLIEKTDIDQSIKDEVKKKKLRYFKEPMNQSEQQVALWIDTLGVDAATTEFLSDDGTTLEGHLEVFLGIELIKRLNAEKNYERAGDVAVKLAEMGTRYGRGVNAFKAIANLTTEGMIYTVNKVIEKGKDALKKKYRQRVDRTIAKYNQAKEQAVEDTEMALRNDKEWIAQAKKDVLDAIRAISPDTLFQSAGIDPRAKRDMVTYGMLLILEGTDSFDKWSRRMKTQFKMSDREAAELWNTKYNGSRTLEQLSTDNTFYTDMASMVERTDDMRIYMEQSGIYNAIRIANKYHSHYRAGIAREFKKKANRAEQAFMKIVEAGEPLTATRLMDEYIKNAGFVGLDPALQQLIADTAEILEKAPTYAMKEAAIQRLMNAAFRNMGKEPLGSYLLTQMYFNMLSSIPTHATNISANFVQALDDFIGGSMIAPLFDLPLVRRLTDSRALYLFSPVRAKENARESLAALRLGLKLGVSNAKDIVKTGRLTQVQGQKYEMPNIPERFSWAADVIGNLVSFANNVKKGNIAVSFLDLTKAIFGAQFVAAKYNARAMDAEDAIFRVPLVVSYYVRASEAMASREVMAKGDLYQKKLKELIANGEITGSPDTAENKNKMRQAIAEELRGWPSGQIRTVWGRLMDETRQDLIDSGLPFTEQDVINGASERFPADFRVRDVAEKRANRTVFRNKPEGTLGAIADAINAFTRKYPAFTFIMPFTNLLANVFNTWLDYMPPITLMRLTGFTASTASNKLFGTSIPTTNVAGGGGFMRDVDEQILRRNELLWRGLIGMVAMAVVSIGLGGEDEDGYPVLNGNGPKDYKKKQELESRGYAWNSIRIGGNYYNYANTPLAFVLSFFGNKFDLERYGTEEQKQASLAYSIAAMPAVILNTSFLAGLGELMKTISQSDKYTNKEVIASAIGRQMAKFVPMVSTLNNIEASMGAENAELTGWGMLFKGVPFIRQAVSDVPSLDHFGRPIDKTIKDGVLSNVAYHVVGTKRFWKPQIELDETEKLFMAKEYFTRRTSGNFKIGDVALGDDPLLEYDFNLITQRWFKAIADAQGKNYASLPPDRFKSVMDDVHDKIKKRVRMMYLSGLNTKQIAKELKIDISDVYK